MLLAGFSKSRALSAGGRIWQSCAMAMVGDRLRESLAFSELDLEFIGFSSVEVARKKDRYRAPSVMLCVSATVASTSAYESLLLHGVGGSRTFGVGRFNPDQSAIFPLMDAVVKARFRQEESPT